MTIDGAIALMRNEEARVVKADIRDRDYIKCELLGKTENLLSAYDMAIKALEREQEPCEDTVSREAVLAIAGDSCLDLDSYEDTKEFCDEIKELPSVAHTQKIGRWIFVDNAHEHARCSECNYGNVDLLDGRPHNYCPSCGSRMDEVTE